MKYKITFKLSLFIVFGLLSCQKTFSQCPQIESILVDACDTGSDEGFNEMVRFKVGTTAINTSNLSVNWPSNSWKGLVQNATTASKVATLNAQITAAGGCGQLIEPIGGVLPANAKVVLVTSYNFNIALNYFGAISENIYIIFQDNATTTGGHFANYNSASGLRTLTMNFGGGCTDSVTYQRTLLIDTTGNHMAEDGATVNFTASGIASYVNNGCVAPVEVFSVDAGSSPISACAGTTISLVGTAQGQQSVGWSASSGSFSSSTSLVTNYTIDPTAKGSITLTLKATNSCGKDKTDTVILDVSPGIIPTFTAVNPTCSGSSLSALPTTSNNSITGTWSPALDNTATKTYTFTPNAGQCATTTTLTITVNSSIVPTFTAVAPICPGSSLSALPTTSNNSITGTWSPALDNMATKTYTFTPTAGQCATTTTLTITVNPSIVPTFTAVNPICPGSSLSALPTTSNNSITGTWSPALDNTATKTYTFTPTAGQCATTTTLTITVNPSIVPTFTAVNPICFGSSLSALPTTSNNSITGTWSPALDNTVTKTYTFTPNAGQCATTTTLTITVNPSIVPTFTAVNPICSGGSLSVLPTTSNNSITGTWSPALDNTATKTYTFTPNAGQCATTTTLTITVNSSIVPTFTAVAPICSGSTLSALPTTSNNSITGTWSPALDNMATKTYTFTPNTGQCATPTTLTITVNSSIVPTFTAVAPICPGSSLSALPTTSNNSITGTWSPALDNTSTKTYTFTPNAGQCASTTTLTITVNSGLDFEITGTCVNGLYIIESKPLSNSFDSATATYQWKDSEGNIVGMNEATLDVSNLLASTSVVEDFPITYNLTVTTNGGCSKTTSYIVYGAFCTIPKGISPDGDAKNDEFDLTGLGVKELHIFNRYGTEVYHFTNYTKEWHGQSSGGDELPDGTYFYSIHKVDGTSATGWVYINRKQ